jgi:hypothetical protein
MLANAEIILHFQKHVISADQVYFLFVSMRFRSSPTSQMETSLSSSETAQLLGPEGGALPPPVTA